MGANGETTGRAKRNWSLWLRGAALLAMLVLACGMAAMAQSTAALNGTVSDPTGAAIPGAKVVAHNTATGVDTTTQTDASGVYLFPSLPIGTYRVEVGASNFQTFVISSLTLEVATSVTRDVQLKVGQAAEHVEVSGEAPLIETSTPAVGTVVDYKTTQQIPLNGRHFTDLALLTAGTVTPPANGFLSSPLRGQGSFGINTAGQREDTTNWLVNGINLNDPIQNQITFQPPIDTLAEAKIDNSTFPAQYGRNAGAIVNMATRSGTNEFHGEAFEFLRNNYFDARNYFNLPPNPQSPFKRNEFGASGGGPIVPNKAFFFLAYEGLRQNQSLPLVVEPVPTTTQRGNASSTAVKDLLALIPAANEVGTGTQSDQTTWNEWAGGTAATVNLNQGSADVDFVVSPTDTIHGYWVVQRDLRQEPTAGTNITCAASSACPQFGDTRSGLRQLMTVSEDHVFSPSLTNTVRLGFNRIHLTFTPNALLSPAAYGITEPAGALTKAGLPNVNVTGSMSFGGPAGEPQGRGDTTVVLNDDVNWVKGAHIVTFGGEIRRGYSDNISESVGSFTFTSLNNFLNDAAAGFTVELGAGNDRVLQPTYEGFIQDTWKWKPNFTWNLGVRYAWNSTPSEARNRLTEFNPGLNLGAGGLQITPRPYRTNNKNFQPRLGFAWDPFKDGKTSIRADYAILTQDPTMGLATGLSNNPPFALPVNISSGTNSITLENPSASITAVSLGPGTLNPGFDDMYAQDWNVSIEREITSTLGLDVQYVGTKATHLQMSRNINQPLLNGANYGTARPFPTLSLTSPVLPAQCAAPNPPCALSNIAENDSVANSNYNGLWVTLNKRVSNGLEMQGSYSFSKSFDYNSLSGGDSVPLQNAYNPRGDYGLSEFDVRDRVVVSGFYQLPFHGNRAIEGWQVGVIEQAQTGNPMTPLVSVPLGTAGTFAVRPDQLLGVSATGSARQFYTNTVICAPYAATPGAGTKFPNCATTSGAAFAYPCTLSGTAPFPVIAGSCHPGDFRRDSLPGPAFINTDFSVLKNTKITERVNLQFRCEAFDLFNEHNLGNPSSALASSGGPLSSFGKIFGTRFTTGDFGSARQLQFALKLEF